jgi:beta-galactosidase
VTAHGWAAPRPETRTGFAELYEAAGGDVVPRELSTGPGCGFDLPDGGPGGGGRAVVLLTSADDTGGRVLHPLNLPGYEQELTVAEHGTPLLGGATLALPGRRRLMLPVGVTAGGLEIVPATAGPVGVRDGSVTFRAPAAGAHVAVRGDVACADPMTEMGRRDGLTVVEARVAGEFTVTRSPAR